MDQKRKNQRISKDKPKEKDELPSIQSGCKSLKFQQPKKSKIDKQNRIKKRIAAKEAEKEQMDEIVKKIDKIRGQNSLQSTNTTQQTTKDLFESSFKNQENPKTETTSSIMKFRKKPSSQFKGSLLKTNYDLVSDNYQIHFIYPISKQKKHLTIDNSRNDNKEEEDELEYEKKQEQISERNWNKEVLGPLVSETLLKCDYNATLATGLDEDELGLEDEINNGVSFQDFKWKALPEKKVYRNKGRMLECMEKLKSYEDYQFMTGKRSTKIGSFDATADVEDAKINEELQSVLSSYVDYMIFDPEENQMTENRNTVQDHCVNHVIRSYEIDQEKIDEQDDMDVEGQEEEQQEENLEGLGDGDNKDLAMDEESESVMDQEDPNIQYEAYEEGEEYSVHDSEDDEDDEQGYDENGDEQEDKIAKNKGYTRGRVLIMTPYKQDCYDIVTSIISLVHSAPHVTKKMKKIMNLDKFVEEYSSEDHAFDDDFRIGVSFFNSKVRLYVPQTKADIIIGSPLGLRLATGKDDLSGEMTVRLSFQSSIEIMYIDKAHLLFMQNFDHVNEVVKCMNGLPKHSECVNPFTEIRESFISNLSKFYRQNIIYSESNFAELNNLISRYCQNYEGLFKEKIVYSQCLEPQNFSNITFEFLKVPISSAKTEYSQKFNFFVNHIWDKIRKKDIQHKMIIFVNSYFEFVKLKSHFK